MLVNGKWTEDWQPVQAKDERGGFFRQIRAFANWVSSDGRAGSGGEDGFAYVCPWASRALIARSLRNYTTLSQFSSSSRN